MKAKAVLLDKDGTLIDNLPYNIDPQRITLSPHAGEGLRLLQQMGYKLLVISNQAGVAMGHFNESALLAVWLRIEQLLRQEGVQLTQCYYCPHHPDGTVRPYARVCDCRKPGPGLLLRAAAQHDIDLGASWMIGDILNDVEAGHRAGCRTVMIDNGNETEWELTPARIPDAFVADLREAAWLIESEQQAQQHEPALALDAFA
ncbi:MAG TPA: HAD family hydrolase [Oxalicibacterium sp.]|nr:HAD family hydrolase [Oxalicibacterium sp.]